MLQNKVCLAQDQYVANLRQKLKFLREAPTPFENQLPEKVRKFKIELLETSLKVRPNLKCLQRTAYLTHSHDEISDLLESQFEIE